MTAQCGERYTGEKPGLAQAEFQEGVRQESDVLVIRVKEPANQGKANQAVIKSLAQHFSVPRSQIRVMSGSASKTKIVPIQGE